MKTTPMGEDCCPECYKILDCANCVNGDEVPMPGNITICIGCAACLKFASDMALEKVSTEELREMSISDLMEIFKAQSIVRSIIKEKGVKNETTN